MNLNQICQEVYNAVSGTIAVGIADLDSGMVIAVHHNVPHFDQDYIDAVSASAVEMFRGSTINRVEDELSKRRGQAVRHSIQEMQMTTPGTQHFMAIVPGHENLLLVLVTSKKVNLGMGWMVVREALGKIAAAV